MQQLRKYEEEQAKVKKVEKPAALLSASGSAPSIDESALAAEEKRQVMRCESASLQLIE